MARAAHSGNRNPFSGFHRAAVLFVRSKTSVISLCARGDSNLTGTITIDQESRGLAVVSVS